ncbi:MAG: dephospho-CoA kinase, partial [Bacteroidota bacterium]
PAVRIPDKRLGIPVYYADAAAKQLMLTDNELRQSLINTFGAATYLPDGQLNRKYLAQEAFGDETKLAQLNALVHPAVHRDAASWRAAQNAPYTLYEAAIVFEIGRQDAFDGILVVAAPRPLRQARVIGRDGTTPEAFAARAAKQWEDEKKEAAADFLIHNDGQHLLLPQILRFHRWALAKKKTT